MDPLVVRHPPVVRERPHPIRGLSAKSSVHMRTQTQSLTPGRRSSPSSKSGTQKAPRRAAPLRDPANHLLRKSCQWTRHSMTRLGKKLSFNAWHYNKIAKGIMGWATRDTMICDLHKHGKMQPNHPDPVGPPLDYIGECQVFNSIQSNIDDLCRFYTLGTTGDLP